MSQTANALSRSACLGQGLIELTESGAGIGCRHAARYEMPICPLRCQANTGWRGAGAHQCRMRALERARSDPRPFNAIEITRKINRFTTPELGDELHRFRCPRIPLIVISLLGHIGDQLLGSPGSGHNIQGPAAAGQRIQIRADARDNHGMQQADVYGRDQSNAARHGRQCHHQHGTH